MRIAFVGKGGSGKSTLSTLFSLYLSKKKFRVGMIDVDVNSHTATLFGTILPEEMELSYNDNPVIIQKYLKGQNSRIKIDEFLKTTPPGQGSAFMTLDSDNFVIKNFSTQVADNIHLMTVGSYRESGIGASCQHSAQTIAENVLWHTLLGDKDAIVLDCVAGNDLFANSLYFQDLIVFVVKPEREGVDVFQRYKQLSDAAGMQNRLIVIGNQVNTQKQKEFLIDNIGDNLLGVLPTQESIIDQRMEGQPLNESNIPEELEQLFDQIIDKAQRCLVSNEDRLNKLYEIHEKESTKNWVEKTYRKGLMDQIDPDFKYPAI